jgi:hypothetical protein
MTRIADPIRSRPGNTEVALLVRITIAVGVALAICLMILGLWAWQKAPQFALDETDKPELVLWAVRCAAVAAAALAQTVLLTLVIGNVYRTRVMDIALRVLTAAVFTIALVSAIALGLAAR